MSSSAVLPGNALCLTVTRDDQFIPAEIKELIRKVLGGGPRIRCPKCAWSPRQTSRWSCLPSCGTSWNTFDTRGQCPHCQRQWKVTQCLSCHAFSPHDDWYAKPDAPSKA